MKAPSFWWRPEPSLEARLLAPLGSIYGRITARRMAQPGIRSSSPVICVGNFVAGGAGKTPAALFIATMLQSAGRTPAFLSRGYGGCLAGPLRVEIGRHTASEVGDEPLLLARNAPAIVSRDRVAGVALAATCGADVVIMDDGLQNPSVEKNFRLAIVDGASGVGNGLCIPAGPLRASLQDQWNHVDAMMVIGQGLAGQKVARLAALAGKPVFDAKLVSDKEKAARLRGRRVLAFAGIGRPTKFFETLHELGAELVLARAFGDHAALTDAEAKSLLRQAAEAELLLVTTEKDMMRMQGNPAVAALQAACIALPVRLELDAESAFQEVLLAALWKQPLIHAP